MPLSAKADITETFSRISLFAGLSADELSALAARASRRRFEAGSVLFLEGEPCLGLMLIAAGTVRIFKSSAAGREILLAIERGPASIAEIPVFDGGKYPASAAAVADVTAYLLPTADFRRLCRQNPEIPLKILTVVGKRLRGLVGILHEVTFGSIRQRIAAALLDFEREQGGSPFELPGTHQELAQRLGTVREVVSRNLGRFQSDNLIRIRNSRISILDADGLRREAERETA